MTIREFENAFEIEKPKVSQLLYLGYSNKFSELIISKQFNLRERRKINEIDVQINCFNFLETYDLTGFTVNDINFCVENTDDKIVVCEYEGIYVFKMSHDDGLYYSYYDDDNYIYNFCKNDEDFFKLLILLNKYSSKSLLNPDFDVKLDIDFQRNFESLNIDLEGTFFWS